MFMDGTTKTVVVDKIGATDVTSSNAATAITNNQFYTFETDKAGNYELTAVAAWSASGSVVKQASGTSAYNVQSVAVAEAVENVSVSKARSNDYVVADGTTYKYNDVASATVGTLGKALMNANSNYDINGDTYNLYLDPNGFVIGVEGYEAGVNLDNYVFVKDTSTNGFDVIAKVMFMDGTTKTVVVDKYNDNDVLVSTDFDSSEENKFYTFKTDKDGNYEMTDVAGGLTGVGVEQYGCTTTLTADATPTTYSALIGNAKTTIIAKDKVYTGVKNCPEIASGMVYMLLNEGKLMVIYSATAGSTVAASDDMVYVLNNNPARMKDADGTNYYIYDVVINGEKTTLEATTDAKATGLYKVTTYTDGRAVLGSAITSDAILNYATNITAAEAGEGVLILDSASYNLEDGAKFFTIDDTTDTVKEISASAVEKAVEVDFFDNYVYAIETSTTDSDIAIVYFVK
jgi:hypothetical protein